jgi:hypothetical protein
MIRKKRESGNEDIGIRLLRNLLFRIYNMIYDLPLRWWEYVIMITVGVLSGLGVGMVLSAMIKVRLP